MGYKQEKKKFFNFYLDLVKKVEAISVQKKIEILFWISSISVPIRYPNNNANNATNTHVFHDHNAPGV